MGLGRSSCSSSLPPGWEQQTPVSLLTACWSTRSTHTWTLPSTRRAVGPRLHTGQPTCFDLSSALGPLGPRPISSVTTHNLIVSTLCPLSTSAREKCTVRKHTCTRACTLYTHTHRKKKKTKRHTQTLYRRRILPHANTVCHTKPCGASAPLPLCLLNCLGFLLLSASSVCFRRSRVPSFTLVNTPILWTMFIPIKGETIIVFLCELCQGQSTDLPYLHHRWWELLSYRLQRVAQIDQGCCVAKAITLFKLTYEICVFKKRIVYILPGSKRQRGDFTWMWLCFWLVRQLPLLDWLLGWRHRWGPQRRPLHPLLYLPNPLHSISSSAKTALHFNMQHLCRESLPKWLLLRGWR